MTDETLSHIKLEFNRNAVNRVEWFAVGPETLRQAQIWMAQQQKTPAAEKLAGWLLTNGGQLDRADGPAFIATSTDGCRREEWWSKGQPDRADGPAIIETFADGSRHEEWWSKGERDRADGPALIETRADGYCREAWYSKGKFVKEETRANLAAIQGVTLFPPGP
jgi:hypothetical protein